MHLDLDAESGDEKQRSSTGLGTTVQMLMQAADSFFMSADMVAERAEAENYHLAFGVSSLGLELQDRFQMFAVTRAFELAGRAKNEGHSMDSDPSSPPKNKEEETKSIVAKSIELMKPDANFSCQDDRNLDLWLRGMRSELGTRRARGTAQHFRARTTLKNYCNILEIVKDKARNVQVDMEDVRRLQEAASSVGATRKMEKPEPVQRGPMHQSEEDKRNWHRAEAIRNLNWISNWDASDVNLLKELHVRAVMMNKNLNKLVQFSAESAEVDWLTVEPETTKKPSGKAGRVKEKLLEGAKFVGKYTKAYLKKLGKSSTLFFSNCWSSFKRHLRNSERRCERENEEGSKKAAKTAGLPHSTSQKTISQRAHRLSSMEVGVLKKERGKVEKAMDVAIHDADLGSLPEDEAKAKLGTVRQTAQELHQQFDKGELDRIDEAEEIIDEVEGTVCKTQRKSAFQRLKDVFRKSKDSLMAGFKMTAPNLGIRGVGMSASGFGGGLEEVVDFRNREIAQFRWGAGFFGASVGGMGMGGYAGIGWKGYKENWTLQEAQVTGLWTSKGLTPSIFGINAGLSVTFGTDADNSVPGPWVPEPHGMSSVLLGWSVGASITKAVVPISVDFGASYCWYLNSECFESLEEFIKYLWLPLCKDCQGTSERAIVSGLRFGIHAPSFPIISEMAFSVIAALYDRRVRETDYKPECSPGSVTTRKDPAHLIRQIGDLMFTNARLLEDLVSKWDVFVHEMSMAEAYNPDMEKSKEYRKWLKAATTEFQACPKQGPISEISSDTMDVFKEMTDDELHGLCKTYKKQFGLELFCDAPGQTRQSLEERLLIYDNLKEGWLSTQDLQKLMMALRSTSIAGKIFAERRHECLHNDTTKILSSVDARVYVYRCMPSLEGLKVLESKATDKQMLRLCELKGLQCSSETNVVWKKACKVCDTRAIRKLQKFCAKCGKKEIDKHGMATKILQVFGGGFIEPAGPNNPFGSCERTEDCWMPNTECIGNEGSKVCSCKAGTCFNLVKNIRNWKDNTDMFPICQAESSAWREIVAGMKRSFLIYRYTLGLMASQIKALPKN